MKNLISLFFAFCFTISAFANAELPVQNPETQSEIVLVSHVDFSKILNMVVLETELQGFTLKLADLNGNEIFSTQVRTGVSEVVEIDFSDIDGGTYQLKIEAEGLEQSESVIVPYN